MLECKIFGAFSDEVENLKMDLVYLYILSSS
jgi:hypothetical protein